MIHSFLLIGQSNMAGRGFLTEAPEIDTTNIKIMRNGRWWKFYRPVNPDRVTSGTNLSESFAEKYAKDFGVEVGIIPCADGGTSLNQWQVGGLLFDHACYMAELASRTSTIAGVLWHQGESDCKNELYHDYEEKLTVILNAFRERLGLYDVPFLVGGLGDYLVNYENSEDIRQNYPKVNRALENIAQKLPMTGFVSAEGLGANSDNLHFSASALYEFGHRYYEEFLKLRDENKVFEEKVDPDFAVVTKIESL